MKILAAFGGWVFGFLMLFAALADLRSTEGKVVALRDSVRMAGDARNIALARYAEAALAVRHDTVRVTRWATRYDTVRAGLDSILVASDSSAIPFPIFADAIHAADSTIAACRDLAHSCEAMRVAADSALAAERRVSLTYKNLYTAVKPSRWDRIKPYVFAGVGFYVGATVRVR